MDLSVVNVCQDVSAQVLVCELLFHVVAEPNNAGSVAALHLTVNLVVVRCDVDALNSGNPLHTPENHQCELLSVPRQESSSWAVDRDPMDYKTFDYSSGCDSAKWDITEKFREAIWGDQ